MNRKAFFDYIKPRLFKGGFSQAQVNGIDAILDAWESPEVGGGYRWHLSYAFATCYHETGAHMSPVKECYYLGEPDKAEAARKHLSYYPWYGRGMAQVTFKTNYIKVAEMLGLPSNTFIDNPDGLLDLRTSALALLLGMRQGIYTGKKIGDYLSPGKLDIINARRVINGVRKGEKLPDKAELIAGYYHIFDDAILAAVVVPKAADPGSAS